MQDRPCRTTIMLPSSTGFAWSYGLSFRGADRYYNSALAQTSTQRGPRRFVRKQQFPKIVVFQVEQPVAVGERLDIARQPDGSIAIGERRFDKHLSSGCSRVRLERDLPPFQCRLPLL